MKFSVFYFSGTGNTKWAVDQLSENFFKRGYECEIYPIEDDVPNLEEKINATDIVGIAFPIYGASMPNIMKRFIGKLGAISNKTKPVFIVTTAGYIDAFGPFCAKKILKNCNFRLIAYTSLKISNNISTPKIKSNFIKRDKIEKRMDKSKEVIIKLINRIASGKGYIRNIGFYLIPGIFVRKASRNGQRDNYLALSINTEKCSQCMICLKNCPTKSIVFSENKFSFLTSCTACMRCYNFCPNFAIYHENKYADPNIYKRYRGPQSILKNKAFKS